MSEEMKNTTVEKTEATQTSEPNVTTETTTKKTGIIAWIKNGVSAIIGAILSFGVTFGFVSAEQEKVMNEKMAGVNEKAEQIVESLKDKNYKDAMNAAEQLVADTKIIVATGKDIKEHINDVVAKDEVAKTEAAVSSYKEDTKAVTTEEKK